MPLYEYTCQECGHQTEAMVPIDERDDLVGTQCGECLASAVSRDVGNAGFVLKGYGWARDGYSTYVGDATNHVAGRKVI